MKIGMDNIILVQNSQNPGLMQHGTISKILQFMVGLRLTLNTLFLTGLLVSILLLIKIVNGEIPQLMVTEF